ncbi:MAG: DUF2911 domain-containing protein [Saprospiraceae bacterium]|nr:DUF2911 domain-containing protein [Saprospiraceae bacterium]
MTTIINWKQSACFILFIFIIIACKQTETDNAHQHAAPSQNTAASKVGEGYADSVNLGLIAQDTLKSSPTRETMIILNDNHIHITYGSPGVRGRVIWGGLVAYDQVWATGAHNATSIMFSKDVIINEQKIPAGTYGFFTIPGKEEWTLILNKNYKQHLADDYNEKEDVIRVNVKPEKQNNITQRLTYQIEASDDKSGNISVYWEYLKISLPFSMN